MWSWKANNCFFKLTCASIFVSSIWGKEDAVRQLALQLATASSFPKCYHLSTGSTTVVGSICALILCKLINLGGLALSINHSLTIHEDVTHPFMLQSWTYSHCFTTIRTMFPLWHHFRKETHWNFGIPHSCADEGKADMESSPTSTWGWECWVGGVGALGAGGALVVPQATAAPQRCETRSPIEPDLCPRSPSHGHKCQAPPSTRSHKRHMHPHQNAATRFWTMPYYNGSIQVPLASIHASSLGFKKMSIYPLLQGFGKPKNYQQILLPLKVATKKQSIFICTYIHRYKNLFEMMKLKLKMLLS